MPCKKGIWIALVQFPLVLLMLAPGGTLLSQKVEVSREPSADLSALRTFGFEQATRSVTDPFSEHPEAERWVRDALRGGLEKLGYEESDSEGPDFRIRISGETQLREREVETGRVYIKHMEQFIEATLKVEFIDPGSGKAVWTAIASDRAYVKREGVDITPEKAQKKIQKGVGKIIQRFKKSAG